MISDILTRLRTQGEAPVRRSPRSNRLALVENFAQKLHAPPAAFESTNSLTALTGDVRVDWKDGELRVTPLPVHIRTEKGCVVKVLCVPPSSEKRRHPSPSSVASTYCGLQSQELDEFVDAEIAMRRMEEVFALVRSHARSSAVPALMQFVTVPAVSPMFDAQWEAKGLIEEAMNVMLDWTLQQGVEGLTHEVLRSPGAPPLLCLEIAGCEPALVVYGHLDKQPPCEGWSDFCGPYTPVIHEGYLYGRACGDDGYALTSIILALKACQQFSIRHNRCVILMENEEESGSPHLIPYITRLLERIGDPAAVLCLDTSVGDYSGLWMVESLRGLLRFDLTARVLATPMHSGTACGVVPSPASILFALLERIEDSATGEIKLPELHSPIPPKQYKRSLDALVVAEARKAAYDLIPGVEAASEDTMQMTLNRTQRPTLCIIGAEGAPGLEAASSVMLSHLTLTCSIRLPPGVNRKIAESAVRATLLTNPPHHAEVSISNLTSAEGWANTHSDSPAVRACEYASEAVFHVPLRRTGSGGSIPFVGALQALFPSTSILLLGATGPDTHAHGPNERLNLHFYEEFTCSLVVLLKHLSESPI